MRWGALVACACAGCNTVFGLTSTKLKDAPPPPPDAPGCAGELFQGPYSLPELDPATTHLQIETEPTLVGTGLELWFTARVTSSDQQDLYVTTRATLADPFAPPQLAAFDDSTADDADPAFSADGLDLVFISTRFPGGAHAWEATRATLGDAFGAPRELGELAGITIDHGLDLSSDGLTLYYIAGATDHDLYQATRPDRASMFDIAGATVVTTNVEVPGVSPDQLELFFDTPSGTDVLRRTRASTAVPFDMNDVTVQGNARAPDVSPDAKTLIFAAASVGLAYRTRSCP